MLRSGQTSALPLAGMTFGYLTVICFIESKRPSVLCRCACGREKSVRVDSLRAERTLSCGSSGCYRAAVSAQKRTKHGLSRHPLYRLWAEMLRRCENPKAHNYSNYGGRGIQVCDRWHRFTDFLEDIMPRPSREYSLDRIDNNRGYEPGNVAWKTAAEQSRNTRKAITVEIGGNVHSLNSARKFLGMPSDRPIRRLMDQGFTAQQAVDHLVGGIRQHAA